MAGKVKVYVYLTGSKRKMITRASEEDVVLREKKRERERETSTEEVKDRNDQEVWFVTPQEPARS